MKINVYNSLQVDTKAGVARVTLNRPEFRNAFNQKMLRELISFFSSVKEDRSCKAVVITGAEEIFCAGADLNWMKDVLKYSFKENRDDSLLLSSMLQHIHECPCPVIARVNGSAIGGGVGLISACDISIAAADTFFALSETRLGLIPAVIYPYLLSRISNRHLRELILTGERFDSAKAEQIGLLNRLCARTDLDKEVEATICKLMRCAPDALIAAKKLLNMDFENWKGERQILLAELIARLRMSEEGQEGMLAFLEERKPNWVE